MSEFANENPLYESIYIDSSLVLRQLQPNEAADLFSLVDNDREYLGKWLPWVDYNKSPDDSRDFIIKTMQKRQIGSDFGFALIVDSKLAGHISLMHIIDDKVPEIGYWISSGQSGRGITTKAAKAITEFGFKDLGLPRIIIKADSGNVASNKVAENIGYAFEGTAQDDNSGNVINIWSKSNSVKE